MKPSKSSALSIPRSSTTNALGPDLPIMGIPCYLRTQIMRQAVHDVLGQIAARHPKDLEHLQKYVVEIRSQSESEHREHPVRGRCIRKCKQVNNQGVTIWVADTNVEWDEDVEFDDLYYTVVFHEGNDLNPLALVAHELGHVCTREVDLKRRGRADENGALELAADWYAYRWGFGRAIARDRKNRNPTHSLVAPGQTYIDEDTRLECRVTRNLCVRYVDEQREEFARLKERLLAQSRARRITVEEAYRQIEEAKQGLQPYRF